MKILFLLTISFFIVMATPDTKAQSPNGAATTEPSDEELVRLKLEALKAQQKAELAKQQAIEAAELKKISDANKPAVVDQNDIDTKAANAQKAKAEADKVTTEAIKSKFNTDATVTGPKGDVTVTGQFIETQMLARIALRKLAVDLAKKNLQRISQNEATIIIYDKNAIEGVESYLQFKNQLNQLNNTFKRMLAESEKIMTEGKRDLANAIKGDKKSKDVNLFDPATLSLAVLGIAQTAAQVAQLFKRDEIITNEDITIKTQDFVAMYFKAIMENVDSNINWKFYYPEEYPLLLFDNGSSEFVVLMEDLATKSSIASSRLQGLSELEKSVMEYQAKRKVSDPDLAPHLSKIKLNAESLKALIVIQDLVAKQTLSADAAGLPFMTKLTRAERMYKIVEKIKSKNKSKSDDKNKEKGKENNEEKFYTIKIDISSRGSNKVTKTFFTSPVITHSAGVVVTSTIFDSDGLIIDTESLESYMPYSDSKSILSSVNNQKLPASKTSQTTPPTKTSQTTPQTTAPKKE